MESIDSVQIFGKDMFCECTMIAYNDYGGLVISRHVFLISLVINDILKQLNSTLTSFVEVAIYIYANLEYLITSTHKKFDDFLNVLSLCETLHFVLYSWPSYFAFF